MKNTRENAEKPKPEKLTILKWIKNIFKKTTTTKKRGLTEGLIKTNIKPYSDTPKPIIKPAPQNPTK